MEQHDKTKPVVSNRIIKDQEAGQRLDNFLMKILKGVPKSRIYKAMRSGEVRINGSRVKPSHKVLSGDSIRIPPIRVARGNTAAVIPPKLLDQIPVLYEDEYILIVDKPSGLAVHGGSGLQYGLIEALRQLGGANRYLELVHRLDRETSGCLMLAKTRDALLTLQQNLGHARKIKKIYQALVQGYWPAKKERVDFPLIKQQEHGSDRKMWIDRNGQTAQSVISLLASFGSASERRSGEGFPASLVEIELKTGRMHQARVHCAAKHHPIAGDRQYGDREFNKWTTKLGLGRLFLHASTLTMPHPITGEKLTIQSDLPDRLSHVIDSLKKS